MNPDQVTLLKKGIFEVKIESKPDGGDEKQDGEDDHQAVEHEDAGEDGGEQQGWRKKTKHIFFSSKGIVVFDVL